MLNWILLAKEISHRNQEKIQNWESKNSSTTDFLKANFEFVAKTAIRTDSVIGVSESHIPWFLKAVIVRKNLP